MQGLGFAPNQETFCALTSAYQQRHRHYHSNEPLFSEREATARKNVERAITELEPG